MLLFEISAIISMLSASCCFGLAIENCGKLYITYAFINDNSVDAHIKLVANEAVKSDLLQGGKLRWFQYPLSPQSSIKQIQLDSSKFEQKELALIIRRLASSDVGTYIVDCKINGYPYRCENDVKLEIPPYTTRKTGYSTTSSADTVSPSISAPVPGAGGMRDSVIIVVALCAVIIAVVVAGIVLLVLRKNATTRLVKWAARLVSYDGGSMADLHKDNDTGSVYNEIDIDNDHVKVDMHAFSSSKLTLLTNSPSLPRRPTHTSKANNADNDYDLIRNDRAYSKSNCSDAETLMEGTAAKVEYAIVMSKSQRNNTHDATDITSQFPEYSKVLKRSEQCKTGASVTDNIESQFPEYSKVLKISDHRKNDANVSHNKKGHCTEYSKVLKRSVGDNETLSKVSKIDHEQIAVYNVTFPAIDCSGIITALGTDDMNVQVTDETNDEPVKYCNLVSRSRRSQARASRASRKELQYAILDHAVSVAAYETIPFSREDELENKTQCQYAVIDFDMEAFIAPVRKAPSSWYKRRNNKRGK